MKKWGFDPKIISIKKNKSAALVIILTVVIGALLYYYELPPLNIKSSGMWSFMVEIAAVFGILWWLRGILTIGTKDDLKKMKYGWKSIGVIVALVVLPMIISFFGSAKIFHSRAYSRILSVSEGSVEDIPSVEGTGSIALMDTASAEKLGNRKIGSLSNVISQYNVSSYTQLDYQGRPVKTSPLRYDGFFKWINNRASGIPGYVIVDPVSMDADYRALETGMKYVPSAYFNENLGRRIRFRYPTAMFGNVHFEIDEEGNPWYVASVYDHKVGLFDGTQVIGAIIVDPVTGDMQKYDTGSIPQWVDMVFSGDLICEQYNNYAQLQNGYWNSIIGQKGCRKITEYVRSGGDTYDSDFGYIAKDGDIWIYTGVTSVNNDSSNIGFILSNERTEETIFINCAGADEFSAMASAEGEVQEKGYIASFPSLILVDGEPTYIMVLKDASGLVKMYAAVNVEQYNMVATATTQKACIEKYNALMKGKISQTQATSGDAAGVTAADEEEIDTSDFVEKKIKIAKLQTIDKNGNTYLYVVDEDGSIYHAKYIDVLDMLLVEEGDRITILTDGENFLLK